MRFLTSSRRNSTEVPLVWIEDAPTPSLWSDWTSHSRGGIVAVVGVGAAEYERPFEAGTAAAGKEEGGGPPAALPEDLKLARRFWAEDLRRMAGRCWPSAMGAMDVNEDMGGGGPGRSSASSTAWQLRAGSDGREASRSRGVCVRGGTCSTSTEHRLLAGG